MGKPSIEPVSVVYDCGVSKFAQEVRCEYSHGEFVLTKIAASQRDETQIIRGLTIENLRMLGRIADSMDGGR